MTGIDLAGMFEFSYFALNRNLNDLTHDDSVHIPEPDGNCINWVLGHVISARGMMLLLTGAGTPLLSEAEASVFQRGSAAMKSANGAVDLDKLKAALDESQKKLIPAIQALSDETLAGPVPEKFKRPPLSSTVGQALATLNYHEAYHNGQIGLLRRLAGKEGAIK